MFGLLGSAVSGLASLFGNNMQLQGQEQLQAQQNQFNSQQVQQQENFQTDMSNTAYQRSMGDMKAAGLNPMLAYMKGGASTPSGAAASAAPAPQVPNFAGDATNSALKAYQVSKQSDAIDADTANKAVTKEILGHKVDQSAAEARTAEAEADAAEHGLDATFSQQDYDKRLAEAKKPLADVNAYAGDGGSLTNVLGRVAGKIFHSAKSSSDGFVRSLSQGYPLMHMLDDAGSAGISYPNPDYKH